MNYEVKVTHHGDWDYDEDGNYWDDFVTCVEILKDGKHIWEDWLYYDWDRGEILEELRKINLMVENPYDGFEEWIISEIDRYN